MRKIDRLLFDAENHEMKRKAVQQVSEHDAKQRAKQNQWVKQLRQKRKPNTIDASNG